MRLVFLSRFSNNRDRESSMVLVVKGLSIKSVNFYPDQLRNNVFIPIGSEKYLHAF